MDQWILHLVFKWDGKGIILYVLLTCVVAGLLALCIGLERQLRGEAAGVRTHALLAIGCSFLMSISIFAIRLVDVGTGFKPDEVSITYDASRIAAGVVTGIGFLGGGVILKDKLSVRGLSTASTLWICAAIGLACGSGFVLEAIIATVVTMFALIFLGKLLDAIDERSPSVIVVAERGFPIVAEMRTFADQNGLTVRNVRVLRYDKDKYYTKFNFAHRTDKTLIPYVCDECERLPHVISVEAATKETEKKLGLK